MFTIFTTLYYEFALSLVTIYICRLKPKFVCLRNAAQVKVTAAPQLRGFCLLIGLPLFLFIKKHTG